MANEFTARVVVGEHSVGIMERLIDNDLNDDDDVTEVSVVERSFDSEKEQEAYQLGVMDTADEFIVLTPDQYSLLVAADDKAEGRAG